MHTDALTARLAFVTPSLRLCELTYSRTAYSFHVTSLDYWLPTPSLNVCLTIMG